MEHAVSTDRTDGAEGGGQRSADLDQLAEAVRAIERSDAPVGRDGPTRGEHRPQTPHARRQAPVAHGAALSGEVVEAARQVLGEGGAPQSLAEAAVDALGERAGE